MARLPGAGGVNRVFYKSCENMAEIPDGVVQTCVTSPPYFGLRDYGVEGQIGLEPTLDAYVERLVRVFREVRRTLRDDGTLWLNLGDSYAGSPLGSYNGSPGLPNREFSLQGHKTSGGMDKAKATGLKPKDLIGVPWAVAFALRADGWWLRSDIVWWKVPCMPESIEDRPTRAHEFIFLLSKSARYFYDADAIREPLAESSLERLSQNVEAQIGSYRIPGKTNGPMRAVVKGHGFAQGVKRSGGNTYSGNEWVADETQGANKRDVWRIAPAQYSEAHFATFPPEIPSLCIRAGSKPGDLVLDPFTGSGTTLEVAEGLGRAWVGYELNEAYRPLIEARLRQRGLFSAGP